MIIRIKGERKSRGGDAYANNPRGPEAVEGAPILRDCMAIQQYTINRTWGTTI